MSMQAADLRTIFEARASAIIRTEEVGRAIPAMEAAVRGGFRVVEFTLTTPDALEGIREFSRRPGLLVSAGTVVTPELAEQAVEAGARLLVSPVFDPEVVAAAARMRVLAMPGVQTPSEMWAAHLAGAPLLKLFPAISGGAGAIRAIRGPLPDLRLVPTNGVDASNAAEHFAAGIFAVGYVAPLFGGGAVEEGRTEEIEARARTLIEATLAAERPAGLDRLLPAF